MTPPRLVEGPSRRRSAATTVLAFVIGFAALWMAVPVAAQTGPPAPPDIDLPEITLPAQGGTAPETAETPDESDGLSLNLDLGGEEGEGVPSESIVLIIGLTLLSVAPSLVIMLTSFTRIVIVFSLLRNALGVQSVPPNQVVVGLSLFLSIFIMGPTLSAMNEEGLQPFIEGELTQEEAYNAAVDPLREFMYANVGSDELELMLAADDNQTKPESIDDVSMSALVPAFILSELKTAFIIGFVVFMPFLVIDLVVSSVLMSLGMMMLPPVFVSLPFKILLFVMVNGWVLLAETLITSFNTT